jgi:DNA-binding response OmpR family regulator
MTSFIIPIPPKVPVANKGTILFIDDGAVIQEMVGGRLSMEGFFVLSASRGETALEMLEKITPDLIILDVSMPGLGGLGFLRQLAETHRNPAPVIIFSVRTELEPFFAQTNVAAFFPKTGDPDLFIRLIDQILRESRARTKVAPSRWRLLLVENDEHQRYHLRHYFSRNGFDVHSIDGGHTLLQDASEKDPHAILIKYMLPHFNGPNLAQQLGLHPATQHIPVIIYDDTGLHANALQCIHARRVLGSAKDSLLLSTVLHEISQGALSA